MALNYSRSVSRYAKCHTGLAIKADDGKAGFFIHYQQHSVQLVEALSKWVEKLTFTFCEYKEGRLDEFTPKQVEPTGIPFMNQMNKHLPSYPDIQNAPSEIEATHKEVCKRIRDTMVSILAHTPSFEQLIVG